MSKGRLRCPFKRTSHSCRCHPGRSTAGGGDSVGFSNPCRHLRHNAILPERGRRNAKWALDWSAESSRREVELSTSPGDWLLAIDTSTEQAAIALFDGQRLAETMWPAGRDQTVSLLDQIDHLLMLTKLAVADLGAVGIAIGPGMFNGLRVGMSVAKGFALSANLPLIGVPTLDAVVLPHAECGLLIIGVLAAGRSRLLWAAGDHGQLGSPRNGTVEELVRGIEDAGSNVLVCGELTIEQRAVLGRSHLVRLSPLAGGTRRPGAVAELAWRRFLDRDFDDPVNLEPAYLHAASPDKSLAKG